LETKGEGTKGYGVQLEHIRRFLAPDKILRGYLMAKSDAGAIQSEWLVDFLVAVSEDAQWDRLALFSSDGLADIVAQAVKSLYAPDQRHLVLRESSGNEKSCITKFIQAIMPFTITGTDSDAIREWIDIVDIPA